jgi:hypothetical protein
MIGKWKPVMIREENRPEWPELEKYGILYVIPAEIQKTIKHQAIFQLDLIVIFRNHFH